MIIQLTGQIQYPITLDASVWIFDDRKILLEDFLAFEKRDNEQSKDEFLKEASKRLSDAYTKDPRTKQVNPNMNKKDRNEALTNSYVMAIEPFIAHAEPKDTAHTARLITKDNVIEISLEQLKKSVLHFSNKGKPLTDNGPVHLYFSDGSNKDQPIKGITKIIIE